jgi:hypothetical protein
VSQRVRPILFTVLLSAAALGGAAASRAEPQTATAPTAQDVLAGLLTEVRGLRVAMEQLASAAPRVQLAFGRLQLQEQRVAELSRRLDTAKQTLAGVQQQLDSFQEQTELDEAIARADQGPDAEKLRQQVEMMTKMRAVEKRRLETDVQRLRTEETNLLQELQVEQGRWSELNQRLDEVERSLGRR